MKRFSSASNKNLPPQAQANEADEVIGEDPEFPNGTGGGGAGDGSASTSGALGTWQSIGPGNVGGRTRALLIDPINPDVMYAAAVAGGIWKTTNGGNSWTPLNDFLANIAVTCMAFDPSNSNTIYAGTGEGFFNADGVRGAGIFKSTDAGANWTRLSATASNANFFFVNDIVVSPSNGQHVYAATRTGVWRSLDGGASWDQALVSNVANGANGAMDLVMRTDQATDYIFAAVGSFARAHIFRNTDAGGSGTWEDVFSEVNQGPHFTRHCSIKSKRYLCAGDVYLLRCGHKSKLSHAFIHRWHARSLSLQLFRRCWFVERTGAQQQRQPARHTTSQ